MSLARMFPDYRRPRERWQEARCPHTDTGICIAKCEAALPDRSVDFDAFLGVNAQMNRRVRDDVVLPTPFENRSHCVLRRAIPRVLRAC
jgi:hypothetical protein